jgi:spore germination protein KC
MQNNPKNHQQHHGKKYIFLSLLLLFCTLLLNGCWDWKEIETLGLVQALGFDLKPNSDDLTITTMIAIPPKLTPASGGSDESPSVLIISMDAPSIYEAFNRINTTVNREITLIQNQVLLIGEEMAKQGVQRWIDNLIRFREMRRTLFIYICKGRAADIMQVKPKLELNPAEYLATLLELSNKTGMFPETRLHDFMGRYETYSQQNYAPLIAKYKRQSETTGETVPPEGGQGESPDPAKDQPEDTRIIGTAVFRNDKLVGELDIYESQALQMLTGKFREALLTIADPHKEGNRIIFRLITARTPVIKYQKREVDCFKVNLSLEAELISIQSGINYTTPHNEKILSQKIAQLLKRRIERVIAKTQKEFRSDIFGFGVKVRNSMLTSTQWEKYRWPDKYPDSKIDVKVTVRIRRTGVQFQPPLEH